MNEKKQGTSIGRAESCANIALAKYWGKSDRGDNLTAVPSLSLTLDALRSRTEVRLDEGLAVDRLQLGGRDVVGRPLSRVVELLDRMRALCGEERRAQVTSINNFPTAAGLASSASGFAALALASCQSMQLSLDAGQISSEARKSSASAARSLFGGFSILEAEAAEAEALYPPQHWDVAMVVAVVASSEKAIGSTGGMIHTKSTSPYYSAWEQVSTDCYQAVKSGVAERDFAKVADAMEHSTRLMHATMMTARPPVLYLAGPTVELMHEIAALRAAGEPVGYTMDAGPNVKVFTLGSHVKKVEQMLRAFPGIASTIVCRPGPAACPLELEGELEQAGRGDGWTLGVGAFAS